MKLTETRLRQIIREELSRDAAEGILEDYLNISRHDSIIVPSGEEMQRKYGPGVYTVSLIDRDGFTLPPAFYRVNDDESVELIFKASY